MPNRSNSNSSNHSAVNNFSTLSNATQAETVWVTFATQLKIWVFCSLLLCAIGGVMNGLLITVIAKNRALWSGSGAVIACSAVLDGLFCIVSQPIGIIHTFVVQYGAGLSLHGCAISQTFFVFNYTLAHWAMLFLAVNRFVALIFPHSYTVITSKKAFVGVIGVIAVGSLTLVLPFAFNVDTGFRLMPPWQSCSFSPPKKGEYDYRALSAILGVYVPLCSSTALYVLILIKSVAIWRARKERINSEMNMGERKEQNTQYRRMVMARLLSLAGTVFCAFILTNNIFNKFGLGLIARYPMAQNWTRGANVIGYMVQAVFLLMFNETYRKGAITLCRDNRLADLCCRRNRLQIFGKLVDSKSTGQSA